MRDERKITIIKMITYLAIFMSVTQVVDSFFLSLTRRVNIRQTTTTRLTRLPKVGYNLKVGFIPQKSFSTIETNLSSIVSKSESNIDSSSNFSLEVIEFLNRHNTIWEEICVHHEKTNILAVGPVYDNMNEARKFVLGIHVISTPHSYETCMDPTISKTITDNIDQTPFMNIIHLHEDVWENKKDIVMARILAKLNKVRNRWNARDTIVQRIPVTMAKEFLNKHHLWGSTNAKFNYGLFLKRKFAHEEDSLVAVATFSPRRHIKRHYGRMYRSHELIRYCAKKDEVVLGGITKLLAQFCRDLAPDDIVTCIDRDFGDGTGWEKIGFEKVQVMPPLIMAVEKKKQSSSIRSVERKYLVGAGIGSSENEAKCRQSRPGIDSKIYSDLNHASTYLEAITILINEGLYPVYDTGVERRMVVIERSKLKSHVSTKREELQLQNIPFPESKSVVDIWRESSPVFPDEYYSPNQGINLLLQHAKSDST